MSTPGHPSSDQGSHNLEDLRNHAAELREQINNPSPTQSSLRLTRDVRQLHADIETLTSRNTKLADALKDARSQLETLQAEIDRIAQPPSKYGIFLDSYDDGSADIFAAGRRMRLNCSPSLNRDSLQVGHTVRLSDASTIIEAVGFESLGQICHLREILPDTTRALVTNASDEERIIRLAQPLLDLTHPDHDSDTRLRPGDSLLVDTKAGIAFERIVKAEVETLLLEEVPNVTYHDIGGLSHQIEQIRDAVELPFLHKDLYEQYALRPPKGVLLYGPPGCGKTLIAKAVANSLAQKIAQLRGDDPHEVKSYFLNIKGPELLNKFVGETERHIRLIFQRAREKASAGTPVIIFFDEMDSVFRTRGSGISSDVETTIVPQLLTEIDGVEQLENVIIIGASNREDMIDPAILRPGRLDVKIKIERPNEQAARDIFSKYLTPDLPLHPDDLAQHHHDPNTCINHMIETMVSAMYACDDHNKFLEVTYANGDKDIMYFKDFTSGAMIQNIVDRAKKKAIKELLNSGQTGLRIHHLLESMQDEFAENEDLPNTTNPDDWARISGKKGERIIYMRTLASREIGPDPLANLLGHD